MNIINVIQQKIIAAISDINTELPEKQLSKLVVELPKHQAHGCLATNAALVLAKEFKMSPLALAEKFKEKFLVILPEINDIDIAAPGFINLRFKPEFWQNILKELTLNPDYINDINIGQQQKINIEFGSPNPTGPLHIGHTRGAIYGDVLANILSFVKYDVTRESYSNDAGAQITILVNSLYKRYISCCLSKEITVEKPFYPGEYLIPVATEIHKKYGNKFFINEDALCPEEYFSIFRDIVVAAMSDLIKSAFQILNIKHDVFFSEKSLHDANAIDNIINILEKQGKTYVGSLPKPKGKAAHNWEDSEQLLFKATSYGDDIDRALQKSNGEWTYFAADAAYHYNKISRGFNKMILILGADHGGYITRMKALINALSDNKANIEIKTCQLVTLVKDGVAVKMSKRDGSFVTAAEIVEQVGADALRFIMLTRKNDALLEFDVNKATEQSKENPIFYVQYAHSRICSIFKNYGNENFTPPQNLDCLKHLTHDEEINLIKLITLFPQLMADIAKNYEAHRLAFYLLDICSIFHSYWHMGKTDPKMRFISDDTDLSLARLTLLYNIKNIIATGLKLFSIKPLTTM